MMRFCIFLLMLPWLLVSPSDSFGKIYKWVDENGKTHYSDKPPTSEDTVKDVKEFQSIEDNSKTETPEAYNGPGSENVTISNIKMKVVKKKKYEKGSSTISSGSGSSSSGGGKIKINLWVSVKAHVASVDGYSGYVRIYLQAVDREGFGLQKISLRGNVDAGQSIVLSERTYMENKLYKKIHEWKVTRVYTSRKKQK